ncbi:preprotein translocase subunit SecA [Candidatus Woesebacteria bacterium]|nr:preprotein translocase subunit SecA [Candidatus Woesebacteria bacterium]MCD8546305.1 preprotein translocase subunit SecA [Candidatus Woesebacteria bacterium]
MFDFLQSIFDVQSRTLGRYEKVIARINELEDTFKKLSDSELKAKTAEFKKRRETGETLELLLPEAFATVREAAHRVLGMRHYDVQLMAGIAFHEGKVAEQKTGEGKTLSATTALYLNALEGKGAHLVTVNDYLAQVGAGWMGPLYEFLDMSVAVIGHDVSYMYDAEFTGKERGDERLEHFRHVTRRQAYEADITYGTNNEFGFDYLRDNMAQRKADQVQVAHHFAIVDEADSILIDEARTPLIISAPDAEPTEKYREFAQLVKKLTSKADYQVDEKMKTAALTDLGVKRLERLLGVKNLYEEDFSVIHHVEQALKAQTVFERDVDYVVRDNQVIIVDEHTGRLMEGRRYSDGLHQAIEAKEGVTVQQESRTLATISLQNYFRLYAKLAGMSGTAVTEAEEFQQIYDMDVLAIPTNKPVVRRDHSDVIFQTQRAKFSAILREIEEVHATGRPILIGTRSIDQNQVVSTLLSRKKIAHEVLNAKNHEREAFIIASAGKPGAITVATNIAGRGVDIVLGGAKPERRDYESQEDFDQARRDWQKEHDTVIERGGLHIVGTARHEARRIDNQLRGRAGRQGDPGSSRFYVSLEDEIMRIFGGEQIQNIMGAMKIEENMPIENPLITRAITQAQVRVEGFFFDQRKNLVQYDDVMNRQREVIYNRRNSILEGMQQADEEEKTSTQLKDRLEDTFVSHFNAFVHAREDDGWDDVELQNLTTELASVIPFDTNSLERIKSQLKEKSTASEIIAFLTKLWQDTYALREKTLGENAMRDVELYVFLSTLDEQWMNHLDDMTNLRDSIWLRGGKEQALAEYKKEAFNLFQSMISRIELEALRRILRIQVKPVTPTVPKDIQEVGPTNMTSGEESPTESVATATPTKRKTSTPKKTKAKSKEKGKKRSKGSYL